jgi:hypothetical protein
VSPPEVLAATAIPASKLGSARHAGLTGGERELYFWILRQFASTGRPASAETREAANRLRIDAEAALEALARQDLVHRDGDGEIAVAYPFSGRPTAHRVRFPSGNETYAMCALDALGIAAMFDEPIEVRSEDPVSGDEIRVLLGPDGNVGWQPESAAVVAGAIGNLDDDSCCACCPVLNFFGYPETAERWLEQHPQATGRVISVADAAAAGRAVFGDVLTDS